MEKEWFFRELLLRLDGKIVNGNKAHKRLMQVAIAEGLAPDEMASEEFLKICRIMETKGKLSSDNLSALIKIFPKDENNDAFNDICASRDILSGKDIDASSVKLNPIGSIGAKGTISSIQPPDADKHNAYETIELTYMKQIMQIQDLPTNEFLENMRRLHTEFSKAVDLFKVMKMISGFKENGFNLNTLSTGSLRLLFVYDSKESLDRLWTMYSSGELLDELQRSLVTQDVKEKCGAEDITLDISITEDDYKICLDQIGNLVTKKQVMTESIGQKAADDPKLKEVRGAERETETKMECEVHKGEITVIVCVTCGYKLLCPQCIDDHTKGHDLQSLKKVASQIKQQLNDTSANYSQILSDIRLDVRDTQALQKDQDVLERQACDKINAQRQLLHKAIDESADNLVKICKERKQKNMSALQDRENILSSQSIEITNNQCEINKILQSRNFAEVIKASKVVTPIEIEDIAPKPLETFDFHTSQINKQSIDTMLGQMATTPPDDDVSDFLGSLRLQTPASLSTSQNAGSDFVGSVRSEGGLTTVLTINSKTSYCATVIHPSVPGYAWVKWYGRDEIQLTDSQGHVTQTVKFNKQILGIRTTPDNRLLVCGWDEKCIYQVVYGSEPSVYFSTTLHSRYICTTDSGDVLVTMVDSADYTTTHNSRRIVSRYSNKGQHLSDSAEYDRFGDRLFVRPFNLSVNNINTAVAVVNGTSNTSAHLVLLDTSLNLKLRYDGKVTPANKKYTPDTDVKFCVRDVTFTPECNIMVTEQYSKSILLLDSDCQLLKTLWRDDLPPTALCLHNDGELWCGFAKEGGGVIKVIRQSTRK